jgi:hypothetical protein
MFANWKAIYGELLKRTKLLSQLATFVLFMAALLSFSENIYQIVRFADWGFIQTNKESMLIGVGFQFLITVILFSRFVALQSERFGWSFLLWVSLLLTTYFYIAATRRSFFANPNDLGSGCMDCFYYDTFSYASVTFTVIFLCYPLISIFKELTLISVTSINAFKKTP